MLDDVNYAQAEGRKLGLRIDLTLCSGWPYGGPNTPLSEAITDIRVTQVPVPAGATSVAVPSLREGESLISADIADVVASSPAPVLAPAPAPEGAIACLLYTSRGLSSADDLRLLSLRST